MYPKIAGNHFSKYGSDCIAGERERTSGKMGRRTDGNHSPIMRFNLWISKYGKKHTKQQIQDQNG